MLEMFDYKWFKDTVRSKGGVWEESCVWFAELPAEYAAIYRPAGDHSSDDDQALVYDRETDMWRHLDASALRLKLADFCTKPPRELDPEELKKQILDILSDSALFPYWDSIDKDGQEFVCELMADYRDAISESIAARIFSRNAYGDYLCSFEMAIDEWWHEAKWSEEDRIIKDVLSALMKQYADGFSSEEEDLIRSIVLEHVVVQPPYDHYFDQELCANIFVDTGDGNHGYGLNHVYPAYDGDYDREPDDAASIVWLAEQQGYSRQQLWDALQEGDVEDPKGFLQSLCAEVANESSHTQCLAFLVRMKLRDLIRLNDLILLQDQDVHFYDNRKNPDCGTIILDKKTKCGLYDPQNGGGSLLEIQLEKDVALPIRFISSALPDGGDGYSIESVYGMCGSAWRAVMKEIREPEKEFVGMLII